MLRTLDFILLWSGDVEEPEAGDGVKARKSPTLRQKVGTESRKTLMGAAVIIKVNFLTFILKEL
jgi:hypothetical protein